MSRKAAHIIVKGMVQGVGYRYFVSRSAAGLGLTGYVRNLPDGNVEVLAGGPTGMVDELVSALKIGPRAAAVRAVTVEWVESPEEFDSFEIR